MCGLEGAAQGGTLWRAGGRAGKVQGQGVLNPLGMPTTSAGRQTMRTSLLLAALALWPAIASADLLLSPMPQTVTVLPGHYQWGAASAITLASPGRADDQFAADQLRDELRLAFPGGLPAGRGGGPVLIGLLTDPAGVTAVAGEDLSALADRGPEAYLLRVTPEGIVAAGNGPAGTFYAVQTLKQLFRANLTPEGIPCLRVLDWPGLRYRGYSDDISRGPIPTMDFFKRQIRTLSEAKMNMLTFYTEHVFALPKYPYIAPPDGITPEQVAELSAYAKQYHVELVGNFQSFGHFWQILRHDELAGLRETGDIITPAKEESYAFLDDVYSVIARAYSSSLFNVNCDETYGLGDGPSKAMAEKIGVGGVYLGHMNRIHDMLRDKYGKRMMMWGDIALQHPDIVGQLAKDTILLSWGYGAADNYDGAIKPFVDAGLDFMVCPGVSCWSKIFPNYDNAEVNIRNYVRDGAKFGAIGMLNTTWDDDGENLFHWNFYGTNWGGECAWNPTAADLECYKAGYAQVNYGARDDRITRAIGLLTDCGHNSLTQYNSDGAFWVRPFGTLAASFELVIKQASDLCSMTNEAMSLLQQARPSVRQNVEDLDYLTFAARRLHFIGRARLMQLWAARYYTEACSDEPDPARIGKALEFAQAVAEEHVVTVEELRAEYQRLWLAENRPWWLPEMLGRYDGLLNDLRAHCDRVTEARRAFLATGEVADPAALRLELAESNRRNTKAATLPADQAPSTAGWWDARWPWRMPVRVEATNGPLVDYPVEVRVAFGAQKAAPESVRVVEQPAGQPARALLTQCDLRGDGTALVAFIAPGASAPGAARQFMVYYDLVGSAAKPAQPDGGVRVTDENGWKWVENERLRALVGPQGAHVYEWYVKALGDLEITQPGRSSWEGFADSGFGDRDAWFELAVESAGPVVARIRATAPSVGSQKLLTFYAGQPYVEVALSGAVGFYWNYDATSNFAADSAMPGEAVFSDGHREPVVAADEKVHGVASDVLWSAKTRPDGLTLANVTPGVAANHMTGPGGGWGGVGIEGSRPVSLLVTWADRLQGDLAETLNTVATTLDMRNQPRLQVGAPQSCP
jgi:hexosaminidase